MKTVFQCAALFVVMLIGWPGYAAECLVLYDDFNTEYIDPGKWFGGEFSPAFPRWGAEAIRQIQDNRLGLMYRSYGPTGAYSERPRAEFVVMFRDPATITTIQATVQVTDLANTGCPGGFESTEAWATLGGPFFGNAASTAEGQIQDMVALIGVMGKAGTAGQPDVVQARALVFYCANRPCTTGTELYRKDLGPITRGERVRLRLQWDRDNHRFIFQRDDAPEVLAPYTEPDMNSPGVPVSLDARHPLHLGGRFQVLEVMGLVDEEIIHAQLIEDQAVILLVLGQQFLQAFLAVDLLLLQGLDPKDSSSAARPCLPRPLQWV